MEAEQAEKGQYDDRLGPCVRNIPKQPQRRCYGQVEVERNNNVTNVWEYS